MSQTILNDYEQPITSEKKLIQRHTILEMLNTKPCNCSEFMKKGISQYNARILELRREGHDIKYCTRWKVFALNKT